MTKHTRKAAALSLCAVLATSALTGCSGEKKADPGKAVITLKDGGQLTLGEANMIFRYDQAQFENGIGSFIRSYYGDIWNSDITGSGQAYGEIFKEDELETMEKLLLVENHAAEYEAELTEEEKAQIEEAATAFLSANTPAVIEKMNADKANVVRMLELQTMKAKAEVYMVKDVDTEVSDEEAAQRIVKYVSFTPSTEEETEAATEEITESASESGESVAEEAGMEAETAAVVSETEVKTQSADVEEASEAAGESVAEAADGQSEALTEAETEEVDPAMAQARAEALAAAQAFLAKVQAGEDFAVLAEEEAAASEHVLTSDYTFGDNDTYPDAAIIEATRGLEDGTLVDHVVEANGNYYVLYVTDAFNEEATETEKTNIVNTRKTEKIQSVYEDLMEAAEFTVDGELWGDIIFDVEFTQETQAEEAAESVTEAAEAVTEAVENASEAASEAVESVAELAGTMDTEAVTE
ncbi:MAG: hypothetical protein Q4B59_01850 [Lachnospiraceae bacterium]|nr:hypothetical protein [Lachnospiraceae bacterium]